MDATHTSADEQPRGYAARKRNGPEFRCDSEVFATPHQGVALATLGCRRDPVLVKEILLSSGDAD
jgi:hypothetical protein